MHPGGGIQVKLVFDCFFVFLGLSKHLRLLFNLSAIHSVTAVPGYLLVYLISIFNGSFRVEQIILSGLTRSFGPFHYN